MAKERAYAAIDFGTTQTAAAVWVEGAEPHLIPLAGRALTMPSAVFHHGGTQLLVGPPALRALWSDPLRGERTPKRKLRHGCSIIDFDGPQFAITYVVGQILGEVYRRVVKEIGRAPDAVCLTRPVTWAEGGTREHTLRAAAAFGGLHCPIVMVSETEAAARHLGAGLDNGDVCLVYDLGGGTCDIAVMEMTRNGLELRAEDEEEIGGETFDALLLQQMISRVAREDPSAGQRLQEVVENPLADVVGHDADPDTLEWRRCMASLGQNVRAVKERLSNRTEAALLVPPPVNFESIVTRAELEQLVADDLEASGESVRRCVDRSHLSPSVAYLAGAASAMPAVRHVVGVALGLSPVLPRSPKGAIALGGVRMVAEPLVKAERARERKRLEAEQERLKAQRAAAKRKAAAQRATAAKRETPAERAAAVRFGDSSLAASAHTEQANSTPGVTVRKVFVSYARENRRDIDQLVEHLGMLGWQTWVDSSLRGGQDWWEEILRRIADCDVFLAIISREALNSVACRREFDWADALGKPVLPVGVEPPPKALPRRFSLRQIVDYSEPGHRDRAALVLAGALATLPPAPPLPHPLPEPPVAPLSYLTDLVDLVSQLSNLDHEQQRQILLQLEPALRSVDPEERRGGRDIVELFSSRDDLYADVDRRITWLKAITVPEADPKTGPCVLRKGGQGREH